jgi:hypothetical protein
MNAYFVQTENGSNWGYLIDSTSAREFTTHRRLNQNKELEIHIRPINEYTIESTSLPDIDH